MTEPFKPCAECAFEMPLLANGLCQHCTLAAIRGQSMTSPTGLRVQERLEKRRKELLARRTGKLVAAILGLLCLSTGTLAGESDWYTDYRNRRAAEDIERRIDQRIERRLELERDQREIERLMDSIYYPTPRESCLHWALDCLRARQGR